MDHFYKVTVTAQDDLGLILLGLSTTCVRDIPPVWQQAKFSKDRGIWYAQFAQPLTAGQLAQFARIVTPVTEPAQRQAVDIARCEKDWVKHAGNPDTLIRLIAEPLQRPLAKVTLTALRSILGPSILRQKINDAFSQVVISGEQKKVQVCLKALEKSVSRKSFEDMLTHAIKRLIEAGNLVQAKVCGQVLAPMLSFEKFKAIVKTAAKQIKTNAELKNLLCDERQAKNQPLICPQQWQCIKARRAQNPSATLPKRKRCMGKHYEHLSLEEGDVPHVVEG